MPPQAGDAAPDSQPLLGSAAAPEGGSGAGQLLLPAFSGHQDSLPLALQRLRTSLPSTHPPPVDYGSNGGASVQPLPPAEAAPRGRSSSGGGLTPLRVALPGHAPRVDYGSSAGWQEALPGDELLEEESSGFLREEGWDAAQMF